MAKGAVVHVHHPAPGNPANIDLLLVSPVDVIVDHGRQQIVGRSDRVEVAGEVKVHFLHWDNLRITPAGCASLHAEARYERGFPDADGSVLSDPVQCVAESHRSRRLSFARRRRIDRGDQHQIAVIPVPNRLDELGRNLGLVMAEGQQVPLRNTELGPDSLNWKLVGLSGDFNVCCHVLLPYRMFQLPSVSPGATPEVLAHSDAGSFPPPAGLTRLTTIRPPLA